ncbi:MAG: tetratricopeptide repeat protein [Chitinophagaceae bacterium]
MKYFFLVVYLFLHAQTMAQQQDIKSLQESAKNFVRQGDYNNAVVTLNKAVQQEPDNALILKDLSFALYLQKDYAKALETIKPLLDKKDADVQVYQVAGLIYKGKEDFIEADKLYKKGLKKFPESALLYNDYGEFLWNKKDNNAIKQWEKGMEVDPNYANNYYNAARFTSDKTWSIIYGEIFVNIESYSRRTIEIKNLLLDGYKKLLTDTDILKNLNTKNGFTVAYLTTIGRQSPDLSIGLTPESLTMVRTRFVLDWDDKYASKFPFRLFEYHRQLLKEGLFEAYNQWLFGPIQNLTAFQNWTNKHAESYTEFTSFQRERVFKLPVGQNYQTRKE